MSTETIRERLYEYIRYADDEKVAAIYTIVEDEIAGQLEVNGSVSKMSKTDFMKQALLDPLFLADVKEVSEDFDFIDNEKI